MFETILFKCDKLCQLYPMQKWRSFWYSFVYIEISRANLILELDFQKSILSQTRLVGLIRMET